MAAHCFGILSITSVLSEHLDVVDEIKLYGTCSTIYSGNKLHRDNLRELRDYYYAYNIIPTLQRAHSQGSSEVQINAPPLYRVCLEFRLSHLSRAPRTSDGFSPDVRNTYLHMPNSAMVALQTAP